MTTIKFKKETHIIFQKIAPILDKMTICVRDGKYTDETAILLMKDILVAIEKAVIENERKNSKPIKEN
jgi:hypothetical protein